MSKTVIFISTLEEHLSNIGENISDTVDFWQSFDVEEARKVHYKKLNDGHDEFHVFGIKCYDYERDNNNYADSGKAFIEKIMSFLGNKVDTSNDQIFLFLHEKDINSPDYLTRIPDNKGTFYKPCPLMWYMTQKGKKEYSIHENVNIVLFQHNDDEPIGEFVGYPIHIDDIQKIMNTLKIKEFFVK